MKKDKFEEHYFESECGYATSILKGRNPFQNRFWEGDIGSASFRICTIIVQNIAVKYKWYAGSIGDFEDMIESGKAMNWRNKGEK